MDKADVLKSEVARLISEQNLPSCPYDAKPCLTPNDGCEEVRIGFGLPEKTIWRCSRFPVRK